MDHPHAQIKQLASPLETLSPSVRLNSKGYLPFARTVLSKPVGNHDSFFLSLSQNPTLRQLLLTALFVASLLTTLFIAFFAASLHTALFASSLLTALFAASFLTALFVASTFGLATSSSRPLLSAIFTASSSSSLDLSRRPPPPTPRLPLSPLSGFDNYLMFHMALILCTGFSVYRFHSPCHPWICDHGVAPDRALDPAVLSRLKQFSAMNKLKKMTLRVIAESLSEEEIAGLREMFKAMDTDNSGSITFDELKAGFRRYGSTLKDTEIRDLMVAAHVDNSGTIDYGEFIAATVHLNKLEHEEHLAAAFSYFDKDGGGYITVDELQQACKEHNMTDAFLEDIIKEVDQDNDGRIDYGEFVAMMQKGTMGLRLGRRTMRNSLNISMRNSLNISMRDHKCRCSCS
ncbi:hypothetical protein ZIOFF_039352 [Zingiber officinale]|uniref:non-specific serine/threonine protein kinase n=1 Tax=Zingiber officinale TaxID=94328 RepID=A0A8J5GFU4_ZINOF|nr:hypothetical protein ZIOFF_039352 [Zingiber officinale]